MKMNDNIIGFDIRFTIFGKCNIKMGFKKQCFFFLKAPLLDTQFYKEMPLLVRLFLSVPTTYMYILLQIVLHFTIKFV